MTLLGMNRVHCDLVLHCLTTRSINTLFKYIDAGYDVMISNDCDENDITLTIYGVNVIQPLEFKREYLHNNPSSTDQRTTLETML